MKNEEGKVYYGIGLDNDQLRADALKARNIMKGIGDATVVEGARIDSAYRKIGGAVAAYFTVQQLGAFTRALVQTRGEIESLEISFRTLVGNKADADALFGSIKKFAFETPMMLGDLAKGAQLLLAFNVEAGRVMPILKQLGDISMGDSQRFHSLTLAFAQMTAAGRLMGQDLLQMINAGFNPLMEISAKTGKSLMQLRQEMELGAISSQEVTDAFASAASEGGRFFGMLESQSKGIKGSLSNLKGEVEKMLNDIGTTNQDTITGSIAAAREVVKHYQQIGEALAVLVGIYGVYKAAFIATEVVKQAQEAIKYTAETEELLKLLSVEQKAKISKLELKVMSAEHAAAVKAEAVFSVQAAEAALAKARVEVSAANQAIAARRAEYVAAKQMEKQRLAELMSIGANGTAKQVETAQRKLAKAEIQRESAAIAYQSATRDFHAKKTVVETAARTANTTASAVNTAVQTANTSAVNLLTVAKVRLTAVTANLNKVIAANKFALILAAVAALGYGLYKLITHQTEAEKAQQKLNAAMEESEKAIGSERAQLDAMFARLKAAKEGTDEYRAAKEAIMGKYGEYLKGLGDEKTALNDVAAAYKLIAEEAEKAARARAMDTYVKNAADDLEQTRKEAKNEVEELLQKKYGNMKGEDGILLSKTYYAKIRPVIDGKEEITDEIEAILSESDRKSGYTSRGTGDWIEVVKNKIRDQITAAQYAKNLYDENLAKAVEEFGESQGKKEEKPFDIQSASLNQLTEAAKKAAEQLQALRNAEEQDADAIAAKEKEIQLIDDATRARERGLTVIKDVKARIEELQKEQEGYAKDDAEYTDRDARIKVLQTKLPAKDSKEKTRDFEEERREFQAEMARLYTDVEFALREGEILAMDEGLQKVLAQNQYRHDLEMEQLERQKAEKLKKIQEGEKTVWESQGGVGKFKPKTTILPEEDQAHFEKLAAQSLVRLTNSNAEAIKALREEYLDYTEQRKQIEEKFLRDIKAMEGANKSANAKGKSSPFSESSIQQAYKKMREELARFDNDNKKVTTAVTKLFADMSKKSASEIRKVADEAERLLEALNGDYDPDNAFGLSKEQFEMLKESPEKLIAIKNEIANIRAEAARTDTLLKKFGNDIKALFSPPKDGEEGESLSFNDRFANVASDIQVAQQALEGFSEAFQNLADLTGSGVFSDMASGFGQIAEVLGKTANMAATGAMVGGTTGAAIGAGIGLWSSVIGIAAKAKANRKALRAQIEDNQMQEYLGEIAIERVWRQKYEWAKKIGEAILHNIERQGEELVKQSQANQDSQDELWAKLQGSEYKEGEKFKKTGLFGWGKGKIVVDWEPLAGKTFEEIEKLAAEGKLSEEGHKFYLELKAAKEEGEDLEARTEEFLESVRETFTGTTFQSIVDGIVKGFKEGKRSASDFAASFKDLMRGAVEQALRLMADEKVRGWYEDFAEYSKDGLDQKEIAKLQAGWIAINEDLAKTAEGIEKTTKINLQDSQKQAEPTSRGFQAMNQETGSDLNGRFTGMQIDMAKIKDQVTGIREYMVENRGLTLIGIDYLAGIEKHTRQLYQMNDRLGSIERNTAKL